MPSSLAIGVPYALFWHLNPKKLRPFFEAEKIRRKQIDEQSWFMGKYVMSAVGTVVSNALSKHSKAEYVKAPILAAAEERNRPLTEEEITTQRQQFVDMLMTMKRNFEKNKTEVR